YYRLNVIEIELPPLRARRDDILPLVAHFLEGEARLSPAAQQAVLRHDWPGNVRELKNALQRARLLAADAVLTAADLGLPDRVVETTPPRQFDDEPDRETIEAALEAAGGVISQAAARLGLSRQALYRRMERLEIGR